MHARPMTWAAMLQLISDDMLADSSQTPARSQQAQELRRLAAELIVDTSARPGALYDHERLQ